MKLADAQTLLAIKKLEGPITERWWCETDEGILLEAWPLGFARGAWGLKDIFTVIPHFQYSALFSGEGTPHFMKVPKMSPHHLWEQEAYVYAMEMRAMARKALEGLEEAPYAMRQKGHGQTDCTPYPEDFSGLASIKPRKKTPAVEWNYQGETALDATDIRRLQKGFIAILERFVTEGGPHGQRTTI